MEFYLKEAFKSLKLLENERLDEKDFDLTADQGVIDELQSFVADDIEAPAEEEIIDVEADKVEDLQDNYVGKVILECDCCHTRIYKDIADVIIDEETGLANVEEECPVCSNAFGWNVIGKIEPFKEGEFDEEETEEVEVEEVPEDDKELSDEEIGEALKEALGKSVKEDFEDPDKVGVDPDRAVEDDEKLEEPMENPVVEDPAVALSEELKEEVIDEAPVDPELKAGKPEKVGKWEYSVDKNALDKAMDIIYNKLSEEEFELLNDNALNAYIDKDPEALEVVKKIFKKYGLPMWALKAFAESWDDQNESLNEDKADIDDSSYYVLQTGGSIGQKRPSYHGPFDSIEQAKETAKYFRKNLTPGERKYYHIGYKVIQGSKLKKMFNESLNEDADEIKTINIDWADDELPDDYTEEDVIKSIHTLYPLSKTLFKINIVDLVGPAGGWPEIELTGKKQDLIDFLTSDVYDVDPDEVEEIYFNESLNEDFKVGQKFNCKATKYDPELIGTITEIGSTYKSIDGESGPKMIGVDFTTKDGKHYGGFRMTGAQLDDYISKGEFTPIDESLNEAKDPKVFELDDADIYMSRDWNGHDDNDQATIGSINKDGLIKLRNPSEWSDEEKEKMLKDLLSPAARKWLGNDFVKGFVDESLNEDLNEVEVHTDNGDVNVSKEDSKVTIDFEPTNEEVVETEDEMIAPLDAEEINEIENNEEQSAEEVAIEDKIEETPEEDELDIDEFDEESFDEMGESYLHRVYENVDSFKTSKVSYNDKKLVVEGVITFKSGKEKATSFVFENLRTTKRGKIISEGLNETFSKSKRAFVLRGSLVDGKFIGESLTYNYNVKQLNESNDSEVVRVYGRAITKK